MAERQKLTRRTGLVSGAKVAFAAPAVVAGLRAGVAFADSGPGSRGHTPRPAVAAVQSALTATNTNTATTTTTKTDTATNTTTTVAGERAQLVVLGRAQLCRLTSNGHQHGAGQLRLLRGANGLHLHVRIRGATDHVATIFDSPADALNGKTVQLSHGRGDLSGVTDAQVAQLVAAGSKDFVSGFHLQVTIGNVVHNFVVCRDLS